MIPKPNLIEYATDKRKYAYESLPDEQYRAQNEEKPGSETEPTHDQGQEEDEEEEEEEKVDPSEPDLHEQIRLIDEA